MTGILIPAGVFASLSAAPIIEQQPPTPSQAVVGNPLNVVDVPVLQNEIAASPAPLLACNTGSGPAANYIQATGSLNLINQPSGCLLAANALTSFQSDLEVGPLASIQSVVVTQPSSLLFNNFSPAMPAPQTMPALPLPPVVLLSVAVVAAWGLLKPRVSRATVRLNSSLTLSQLQVMRC